MTRTSSLVAAALAMVAFGSAARAQVAVGIRLTVAPPLVRIETPPAPPGPDCYWIGGHWRWEGGRHVWTAGNWVTPRPGEVYVRAHWVREGAEWVFRPGHWAPIAPPTEFMPVTVMQVPPPPRVEVMTAPPSAEHFWIAGHWGWERNRFEWTAGRWEAYRPGFVWAPAHWVHAGAEWRFAGGHWQKY